MNQLGLSLFQTIMPPCRFVNNEMNKNVVSGYATVNWSQAKQERREKHVLKPSGIYFIKYLENIFEWGVSVYTFPKTFHVQQLTGQSINDILADIHMLH